ncbi:pilus assembly protein [Collinsella sp. zg1085]|nr:pilus assembly protein [Collinsella sp. zg1085]
MSCIEQLLDCAQQQIGRVSQQVCGETAAQASVEAAITIPVFMLCLIILLQPACVFYTRAIMESAAGELARLMITAAYEDDAAYTNFALRRLEAVPNLSIFHEGTKQDWDVSFERGGTAGAVQVNIQGQARPLPLLGSLMFLAGKTHENGLIPIRVSVKYTGRPSWLEGTYDTWVSVWN